jgi:hypothetical protein
MNTKTILTVAALAATTLSVSAEGPCDMTALERMQAAVAKPEQKVVVVVVAPAPTPIPYFAQAIAYEKQLNESLRAQPTKPNTPTPEEVKLQEKILAELRAQTYLLREQEDKKK